MRRTVFIPPLYYLAKAFVLASSDAQPSHYQISFSPQMELPCNVSSLSRALSLMSPLPQPGKYPRSGAENVLTPEVAAPKLLYEAD